MVEVNKSATQLEGIGGLADQGHEVMVGWLEPRDAPAYVRSYAENSGLPVTVADLDGKVRCFSCGSKLIGGYRLATPATRYPALVGEQAALRWPFSLDDAVEVTHLWMDPWLASSPRRAIYGWMLADVLATKKPVIVGGAVDPMLARQQQRSLPHLLERCPLPELGPHTQVEVYFGTPDTLLREALRSNIPLPWLHLR